MHLRKLHDIYVCIYSEMLSLNFADIPINWILPNGYQGLLFVMFYKLDNIRIQLRYEVLLEFCK